MINELIEFIKDSIISLKKEGIEPNTIFLNYKDSRLLEKTEELYKYFRPAYKLNHPTTNSKDKLFGLDIIYTNLKDTYVCKTATIKHFKRRLNEMD